MVLDEDERSGDEDTREVETDEEDDQRDMNERGRGCRTGVSADVVCIESDEESIPPLEEALKDTSDPLSPSKRRRAGIQKSNCFC